MRKTEKGFYQMAEFFVMKKYRRKGIGRDLATSLFSRFAGPWGVATLERNTPAQEFWQKVISRYTGGDYKNVTLEEWHGPVWQFSS